MSDQALYEDPKPARATPSGPLLLASLGWLAALIAVLVFYWPLDSTSPTSTGPHLARLTTTPAGVPVINALLSHFLDAGIYVVLLAGMIFLLTAWVRASRGALRGLAVVGALGLMYVAGMALYTGPMLAVCGFTLILFSALIGWSASRGLDARKQKVPSDEGQTGDYAIHSPA